MIQWSYNISDAMKKVGFTSVTLTSILLILWNLEGRRTETPWDPKKDGDFLRCYYPPTSATSSQTIDVAPPSSSGALVLFNSRELEHEVLPRYRTRWALVGWFMAKPNENKKNNKKWRKKRLLSLA
jgi:hypothetical protein